MRKTYTHIHRERGTDRAREGGTETVSKVTDRVVWCIMQSREHLHESVMSAEMHAER